MVVMVVMVSGIYGPTTGSIDPRNHDNHDNHYNSLVLSTFFQKGTTTIKTPLFYAFLEKKRKVAEAAGKPLQLFVVMVSLRFRRPFFPKTRKTGELSWFCAPPTPHPHFLSSTPLPCRLLYPSPLPSPFPSLFPSLLPSPIPFSLSLSGTAFPNLSLSLFLSLKHSLSKAKFPSLFLFLSLSLSISLVSL